MPTDHPEYRSSAERLLGYASGILGAALLIATAAYGVMHWRSGLDFLYFLFGGLSCSLGLSLIGLGRYLAASSATAQRDGCSAAVIFGIPLLLILAFLIWSLFQTTHGAR